MAPKAFKLTIICILVISLTLPADAVCPSFCYCKKKVAKRICKMAVFSSRCEVQRCRKPWCGKRGFRCYDKKLISPTPTPTRSPRPSPTPTRTPKPSVTPSVTPLPSPPVIDKPTAIISEAKKVSIQRAIVNRGGCKANVCFAIDGSGSMTSRSFKSEKDFVTDVASIISIFEPRVAATQYSRSNYPITELTTDVNQMVSNVDTTTQKGGSTDISAGINYCGKNFESVLGQANKVITLGDGFDNTGGDAVQAANAIFASGGSVAVVSAGENININALLNLTGNNPDLMFTVDNFNDRFALIQIIEELSFAICQYTSANGTLS